MENLFASLSHPDSIMFLISVLFTFLLGFLTGWILWGSRARRFQKEAAKWKKSYDELSMEHKALRDQFDLKEADLVKAQREADEAREQLSAFYHDKARWQTDLDSALNESVRLQASLHTYEATNEELNNQILGLKARIAQLTKESEKETAALDQVSQMQSSFNAALGRIGGLEDKINLLLAENEALRAAGAGGNEQLAAVLNAHADSSGRIALLEAKMNALVEENDSLRSELHNLKIASTTPAPEPVPVIGSDKDAIVMAVSPSAARDEVLAAIGNKIPTATEADKDDLTRIKGIGNFIEKKLNDLGIYTFEQVSMFDQDLIEKVTDAIEFFPGRIVRDNWTGQAAALLNGKLAIPLDDDLKLIEGIGPKIEVLLKDAGIKTFRALSETSADRLKEILDAAGDNYRIHDPTTWPEQAQLAADGNFEKLKEYQDFLLGGREPGN